MIKEALKQVLRDTKEHLRYRKYKNMLPKNYKSDDLYIVEYPKSGITWLIHLLGNVNMKLSNNEMKITRFNFRQVIPDIHISRIISETPIYTFPNFRMIKSHYSYCPYYIQVLYLIRNPFDVMNSYYKYAKQLNQFDGTITEFIKHEKFGILEWVKHVESWIMRENNAGRSYYVLRYEDLIEDPGLQLKTFYKNYGINLNQSILDFAVNNSNLSAMRKNEEDFKKNNPNYNMEFVRKQDEVQSKLNKNDRLFIVDKTRHVLERFYPELLNE